MSSGSPATQLLQLPLGGSLAQQSYARFVDPPGLLRSQNLRQTHDRAAEKRPGNDVLFTLAQSGGRLASQRDELVAVDGYGALSSYSSVTGAKVARGYASNAVATREGITATPFNPGQVTTAYGNGVYVHVWATEAALFVTPEADIYYSIVDATTGTEIVQPTAITTGAIYTNPRVMFLPSGASSNVFVIVYGDSGANIIARSINSSFVLSGATTIANNAYTNTYSFQSFNAAPMTGGAAGTDTFVLAYQNTTGTKITARQFSTALAQLNTLQCGNSSTTTKHGFGISATTGDSVWIYYAHTNGGTNYAEVTCLTSSTWTEKASFPLVLTSSASALYGAGRPLRLSATQACVVYSGTLTQSPGLYCPVVTTSAGYTGSATPGGRHTAWTRLASDPFLASDGRGYVWIYKSTGLVDGYTPPEYVNPSLVLCDLGTWDTATTTLQLTPTTTAASRIAYPDRTDYDVYFGGSQVCSPSAGKYVCAERILKSNDGRSGLVKLTADFTHTNRWQPASLNSSLFLTPGNRYDGRVEEMAFVDHPMEPILTVTSGGSLSAGTYYIVACWEWVDKSGNIHRSQPSYPRGKTITGGSGNYTIQVEVPACTVTKRHIGAAGPQIGIVLYMTAGTSGTSAGPFYRRLPFYNGINDTSAELVTIDIDADDLNLASYPALYTTGGVLANVCPPSFSSLVTYRGRLCGVGDDGVTVWFSKVAVDGEAVSFADAFTISAPDENERIVALTAMDDRLFAFSRSHVYWIAFDGPGDAGGVSDLTYWRRLASDMGCIEPRSIVLTPAGIIFQSEVGLQLLTRGMQIVQPTWGLPVQDEMAAYPVITSSVVHPFGGQVLFGLAASSSTASAGQRLVFDYTTQAWGTDTLPSTTQMLSALSAGGSLYWLDASANVWKESETSWLDSGAWVTDVLQTAWLKPSGLQGLMKAIKATLMCERYSSHGITLEVFLDYSATAVHTQTWTAATVDALAAEQMSVAVNYPRAQAVSFRITGTAPVSLGTGRGCAFVGLALEADPLSKTFRLPAAQKA